MLISVVSSLRCRLSCLVPSLTAAALLCLGAAGARAATTLWVDTLSDTSHSTNDCSTGSGTSCSLRDAINQANSDGNGDTIKFNPGLTGTITPGSQLPGLGKSMTISGPGANLVTISGNATSVPIFNIDTVNPSLAVNISGLTVANAKYRAGGSTVSISYGTVTVSQCAFSGNSTVGGQGGAIYNSAGGTLTVIDSTFAGNSATGSLAEAGAIDSFGSLTIINSTFIGNTGNIGGAVVDRNRLTVINSTFSGNSAGDGGAIYTYGAISTVNNNIFSGNTAAVASQGGAVLNDGIITATNNVFWNNLAGGSEDDCEGCTGNGNSVSGSTSASSNPLTLPLALYGGTTETLLPQPGSAATCAGSYALAVDGHSQTLTSDQRGFQLSSSYCNLNGHPGAVDAGAVQANYIQAQSTGGGLSTNGSADCPGASCTLTDAVAAANSAGGDIDFASNVNGIKLGAGLTLNSALGVNIIGPGASSLTVTGVGYPTLISVFTVNSGASASLYGLTVTGGYADDGAGILNSGTLTLTECAVTSNAMPVNSFGIGGGIYNGGVMTVLDSTISGNFSSARGGGVGNYGTMTILDSAIAGNESVEYGGGLYNDGAMTILDSTISGNSGPMDGGGIYNDLSSTLSVFGSTVAGNQTGGSNVGGGGIYSAGTLSLTQSTVTNNRAEGTSSAGFGGLVFNTGSATTLANTIVAGNSTNGVYADTLTGYNDNGGNLVGTSSTDFSPINPNLSQLQLNGMGATLQTMIPLPGSAAICAGLASNVPSGTTTDERGYPLQPTNGYCTSSQVDAGAVQTNYTSVAFVQQPAGATASTTGSVAVNSTMTSPAIVQVLETDTLLISPNTDGVNGVPIALTLANGDSYLTGNSVTTAGSGASAGEATFSNLQVSQPEMNDTLSVAAITIVGSTQLGPVTSDEFDVIGSASRFAVTAPSTATAGSPFSITVTAKDSAGNTANGYTGTVQFTTSDTGTGIALPANYSFAAGDNGVHTFTSAVTLVSAGSQTVTTTDTSNGGITGNGTVTVVAGTPAAISVTAGSGQSAVVTQAFAAALAAKVTDAYGNPVSGVPVTFTAPSTGASGTFSNGSSTIVGTTNPTVQVSESFAANASAGSYSVTARATGVNSPATFALTNSPASTITAASSVSAPSSALAQNVTLSATVSVSGPGPKPVNEGSVTFNVPGIGSVSGTVSNGSVSAVLTIPANATPGTFPIQATYNPGADYTGSSDSSQTLTINSSNTAIAAANAAVTYSATDQLVQLSATVVSSLGPVNGGVVTFTVMGYSTTSAPVTNGAASAGFTVPGGTAPGTFPIIAIYSGAGLFGATSDNTHSLAINPAPTQLVFGTPPADSIPAGGNAGSAITVEEMSSGNVLVTSASDTITLTVTYPDGSTQVYTQSAVNGVATFNLSAVALTEAGDYIYTATATGPTNAVAAEEVTGTGYTDPRTSVGSQSGTQTVVVQLTSDFTLGSIGVVTQGATNLDFQAAASTDPAACTVGTDYSAGQTCTVNYTFNPTRPGARYGAVVLYDNSSPASVAATAYLEGIGVGPAAVFSPASQSTLVTLAANGPQQLVVDASGVVYIPDARGTRVRSETPSGGSYVFGNAIPGGLTDPAGIAIDGAGNLYIADTGNNRIVRATLSGGTYALSTIVSGLNGPKSVAVDGSGNLYVADTGTGRVLKETFSGGSYTESTLVTLPSADGVAVDSSGVVYIADSRETRIRTETLSGGSYVLGTAIGGGLSGPTSVTLDGSGNLYVADTGNNRIVKGTLSGGTWTSTTLVSGLNSPAGVAVDDLGNLFISDSGSGRVLKESYATPPSLTFAVTAAGQTSSDGPQTVTVGNIGNAGLNITNVTYAADFPKASGVSSDCTNTTTLTPATTCTLSIDFSPVPANVTGPSMNESVSLQDNTLNGANVQQSVTVQGMLLPTQLVFGTPPAATLVAGGNAGAAITVNEILAGTVIDTADSTDTITLTVTYPDGSTQVYAQTEANGTSTFNLSAVTLTEAGTYTYTATTTAAGVTSAVASEELTGTTYTAPTTDIGKQSDVQTAVVPITSSFTLGTISVVTQGVSNLDFQLAATQPTAAQGGCTAGTAYVAPATCTVNYTFKPTAPGARYGAFVLYDNNGGDPAAATAYLQGNGVAPEAAFSPSPISTLSLSPYFNSFGGMAADPRGNLYLAVNSALWEIPPGCTSFATNCQTEIGATYSAQYGQPQGVALDGAGNVYFADAASQRVGMLQPGLCNSPACETWLGGGLNSPTSVAVDGSGNVYVGDQSGVQEMAPGCASSACVTTLNGGFGAASDIKLDGIGNLYVADGAAAVKMMPAGCNSPSCVVLLGNGSVQPARLTLDGGGNVYEAENNGALNEIPRGCASSACIISLANVFQNPIGLAVDESGNVYVTGESGVGAIAIQEIQRAAAAPPASVATLSFAPTYAGATSTDSPQKVTVQNIGNAVLKILGVAYAADFPEASPATTDCTNTTTLAGGSTCTLSINFSPLPASATANATPLNETVSLSDNNLNASSVTQQVAAGGTEILPATRLEVSAPASATAGSAFSITVTALDALGDTTATYSGTVHFTSTDTRSGVSLPTDYTFVPSDYGVHTFTNLATLVTAGSQTITATDAADSINGVSNAIAISALATPTQIVVSGFPTTAYVGVPASGTVSVADQYGNAVPGFSGSATVTTSDSQATVSSPVSIANGTGTFTATFQTLGGQSITASISGSGLAGVPETGITVGPIPNYIVAVTTDLSSGVAGNCVNQNTGQSSTGSTDNSSCSLRDAVAAADAATAGSITFDPTAFASPQTIKPANMIYSDAADSPNPTAMLSITGPPSGVTLDGSSLSPGSALLSFGMGRVVNLAGLTMTHAPGPALRLVENANATVSNSTLTSNLLAIDAQDPSGDGLVPVAAVTSSTFSGNQNTGPGGAIYAAPGTITVSGSSFSGNTASTGAAAYVSGGSLTIQNSSISGNMAVSGAGIYMTGLNTILSITNSTFAGNSAGNGGGAGLWLDSGTANIEYSTFSGNTADGSGGAISSGGTVSLTNVTVYGNQAVSLPGGGIVNFGGTFTLTNSIVAGNLSIYNADAMGAFATGGHNLIGDGSGMTGLTNGVDNDQVGTPTNPVNPMLAPLGSYGGPTQTMALLPGSPAIGAGDIHAIGTRTVDQRGQPATVGGSVDIGAFESQGFTLAAFSGSPQSAQVTQPFSSPLVVQVTANNAAEPVAGGLVNFSAPAAGATALFSSGATETIASNGQASATATAYAIAGSYYVSAAIGSNSAQFALTNTAGSPASIAATSGGSQSATVATAFTNPLVVTVQDRYGNLVPGASVTFTAPGSGASGTFSNGANTITGTTNASGQLSESITANTVADIYFVNASAGGPPVQFFMTNTSGGAAAITATSGSGQSAFITGQFANRLVATVTDQYGNPVSGVTVTFTAPGSGASGTFGTTTTGTSAYPTDVTGQRSETFTANGIVGSYTVTASASGVVTPASYSLTNNPPPTYVVNTNQDDDGSHPEYCTPNPTTTGSGNCTLRDALSAVGAVNSGTINFDSSVFKQSNSGTSTNTILLSNGAVTIPNNTTISSAYTGSGNTLSDAVTVSGQGQSGVFQITSVTANISITGLAIRHGLVSDPTNGTREMGGGLLNNSYSGPLTIAHSTFSNNTVSSQAGSGAAWGGAIFSNTDFTLNDCVFSGNSATAGSDSEGGAIFAAAGITATNIVMAGNTAISPGGGAAGGGINAQTATITGSTFTGNQVSGYQASGGGIYLYQSSTLNYSTFSGNSASGNSVASGGGIYTQTALTAAGDTISGNTSNQLAGAIENLGNLILTNSIVTGNSANNGADGYIGGIYSYGPITGGNNFIGGNPGGDCGYYGCPSNGESGNIVGAGSANLSNPGNYGGPTKTMIPLPGSPAICAGAVANIPSGITTDQRGYPLQPSGGYCPSGTVDMGAVQTNYDIEFSQQPSTSSTTATVTTSLPIVPAPAVSVTEYGAGVAGASVGLSVQAGTLGGPAAQTSSGGTATFTGVSVSPAESNDTLTATLLLNPALSLTLARTSYPFNVQGVGVALTSPAASTYPGGPTVFSWNSGSGMDQFQLYIGTTGHGSSDMYKGPDLPSTATSSAAINIPMNGSSLFVRFWYKTGASWLYEDYTWTEATAPTLTNPSNTTLLAGPTTFTWNPGVGVDRFQVYVGTTGNGSSDVYKGPDLPSTATSSAAINIPANGSTLYVRLWFEKNSVWSYQDSQYNEATAPQITGPSTTTLIGGKTTFTWDPGSGASQFQIYIGTTGPGSRDVYWGPDLPGTTTSISSINLPMNGATLYVRLWFEMNNSWQHQDYTYAEAAPPSMSTPTPGSTIGGGTRFTWNPGTGATALQLYIGATGAGSSDIYRGPDLSGTATSSPSVTITAPNGATLNVRLWYLVNGNWQFQDYTYTEAP